MGSTLVSSDQLEQPNYQYAPLQPQQIRLIQLHRDSTPENINASLRLVSLDENPKFKALSYCWGDPTLAHHISLSSSKLSITENLYQFLVRFLELGFSDDLLWIDAICIDQTNPSERGYQVKLMGEVFFKAEKVIIWLGESTEYTGKAFELVKFVGEMFQSSSVPFSFEVLNEQSWTRARSPAWVESGRLMQRPWFSRIWVVQEVVLSQEATIVCGRNQLPWKVFVEFAKVVLEQSLSSYCLSPGQTEPLNMKGWGTIRTVDTHRRRAREGLTMEYMLKKHFDYHSTDPRDKIFGILGMCKDANEFVKEPDYSCDVSELYSDITRKICLRYNSLQLFTIAGIGWERLTRGLPSWAPDFSNSSSYRNFGETFSTSIQKRAQIRFTNSGACLAGIILDEVSKLGLVYEDIFSTKDAREWYLDTDAKFYSSIKEQEFFSALCTIDDNQQFSTWNPFVQAFVEIAVNSWKGYRSFPGISYQDPVGQKVRRCWDSIVERCARRRMFSTTQERIGICPPLAKIGDVLFVPFGSIVPFLVRPLVGDTSGKKKYQLVGNCYVSGIMRGESLKLELQEIEVILV